MLTHSSKEIASPVVTEAKRLFFRYAKEVVVDFGICPWAHSLVDQEHLTVIVVENSDVHAATITAYMNQSTTTSIQIILFPFVTTQQRDWQTVVSQAASDHHSHHSTQEQTNSRCVAAAFHPQGIHSNNTVSVLRSSPDITLQIVKQSVLQQAAPAHNSGSIPGGQHAVDLLQWPQGDDVVDQINKKNDSILTTASGNNLREKIADIIQDRNRVYRLLTTKRAPLPMW